MKRYFVDRIEEGHFVICEAEDGSQKVFEKSKIQGDYNGYLLLRRSKRKIQLAHRCAEILSGFRQGGIRLPEIGRRKDKAIHEIQ